MTDHATSETPARTMRTSQDSAPPLAGISPASAPSRPRFIRNLAAILGGQAACVLIGLITEVSYARLLGPEGRGQISLALMAIALGALAGGLGGEIPIIVWTADRAKRSAGWLYTVFFIGFIGSAIACAAWVLIYWKWTPAFLKGISPQFSVLIAISIPLGVFVGYLMALLTGSERFRARASLAITSQLTTLLSFLLLIVILGRTTSAALFGYLIGLLATTLVGFILLRDLFTAAPQLRASRAVAASSLSLGLRGQVGNLATFFNYRLDVFIVNYFLNPAQVGIYAVGVVVSEGLWQIPQAAALALFPRTARTIEDGATDFTCTILRQIFLIASVSGLLIAFISPIALPLVFGSRFAQAIPVIWILLPGTIALALGKVISADLAARRKPEYSSVFAIVALVTTIGLDLLLIPRMGIKGAALASSIAYFVDAALLAAALQHELHVSWSELFIPKRSELLTYWHFGSRLKSWFAPSSTAAANGTPS